MCVLVCVCVGVHLIYLYLRVYIHMQIHIYRKGATTTPSLQPPRATGSSVRAPACSQPPITTPPLSSSHSRIWLRQPLPFRGPPPARRTRVRDNSTSEEAPGLEFEGELTMWRRDVVHSHLAGALTVHHAGSRLISCASSGSSVRVHVPGARRRLRWCSALFALKRLEPVCCRVALCKRRFAQSASGRQRRVD